MSGRSAGRLQKLGGNLQRAWKADELDELFAEGHFEGV